MEMAWGPRPRRGEEGIQGEPSVSASDDLNSYRGARLLEGDTIKCPQATPTRESERSCPVHKHRGGSPTSLILGPGLSSVQGILPANFPREPPMLWGGTTARPRRAREEGHFAFVLLPEGEVS